MLTDIWYEVIAEQSIGKLQERMFDLMTHNEVADFLSFASDGEWFYQAILRQKGFPR